MRYENQNHKIRIIWNQNDSNEWDISQKDVLIEQKKKQIYDKATTFIKIPYQVLYSGILEHHHYYDCYYKKIEVHYPLLPIKFLWGFHFACIVNAPTGVLINEGSQHFKTLWKQRSDGNEKIGFDLVSYITTYLIAEQQLGINKSLEYKFIISWINPMEGRPVL